MIRLIASDLDGTLLNAQKKLPDGFFETVARLKKRGVRFVAASGRSLFTLKANFAAVQDQIDYICDNGAVAYANGKRLLERALPQDALHAVIDECAAIGGLCPLLCCANGTYHLPTTGTDFSRHIDPYYINQILTDDLKAVPEPVFKVAICDLLKPAEHGAPRLVNALKGAAELQISGDVWMDVMARGVNKGGALKAIQEFYGIGKSETMAFGDYYNDVELLAMAEESYVMANANDDMKRYGKYVCGLNTEDGVMKTIQEKLFCETGV